jgi:hypothetical protein
MAKNPNTDQQTREFFEKLGVPVPPPPEGIFAYSVKIVCGRQAGENCCCVAGTPAGGVRH